MLKIIINNQEADLGDLKGGTLKYNPGIFEQGSFKGSYSIPFTLPGSAINNLLFEFPYKMGNANKMEREYAAQIWHSGIKMADGLIKASKFPHKKINCIFYIDNGNLIKDFNTKTLQENDFGGYKPWVTKNEYSFELDDFLLYQVKNEDYFKGTLAANPPTANSTSQNLYSTGFNWLSDAPSIITPFPLLWRTLKYLFTNKGFNYSDSFFSSGDYRTINIFNTVNAIEPQIYTVGTQKFTRNVLTRYNLANHLPALQTSDFIRAIQDFFNIRFYVRDYKVEVVDRLALITNSNYQDLTKNAVGHYTKTLTGKEFNGIAFNILKDNTDTNVSGLPDVSENENITETTLYPPDIPDPKPYQTVLWKQGFANYYKYINQRDFNPGDTSDHWMWYPYYHQWTSSHSHKEYTYQQGIYFGEREMEISANLSPLPSYLFDTLDIHHNNYMPKVKQPGNSYQHAKVNPFSFRVMMYNGMQDVEGLTQPHGVVERGGISMTAYWSYYSRWEAYLNWRDQAIKETYEQDLKLTASEIKNFNFAEKKLINGNLFFITNMSVQLTNNKVLPVKCTMIKAI